MFANPSSGSHSTHFDVTDELPSKVKEPPSFARVARQLHSRSTDLLGIAIVVIGGLMLGGQLVEWWSVDLDETQFPMELAHSVAGANVGWGVGKTLVSMQFGDHPFAVQRQQVHGDFDRAFDVLLSQCRETVQSDESIGNFGTDDSNRADVIQQKLGQRLNNIAPIEERPGQWRLYRLDHPMTTIVATRLWPDVVALEGHKNRSEPGSAVRQRVVCWGLVVPYGNNHWTLYWFRDSRPIPMPVSLPEFPMPPNSRQVLSIRDQAGGVIMVFEGEEVARAWIIFFQHSFCKYGWKVIRPWEASDAGWSCRYAASFESSPAWIDVMLRHDGESSLSGFMHVTIRPTGSVPTRETEDWGRP